MHYDLSGLGSHAFENMVQAVAVCVLGDGVSVFGSGPDGGREATFDGPVSYPDPSPEGLWDGYGVMQAKFKETSGGTAEDTAWFKARITAELNDWTDPLKNRVKHGRHPST